MFIPCIIRRIRNDQQHALICNTLYSMHAYALSWEAQRTTPQNPAHRPRNHTLYDIPPIRIVFHVTQKGLRSSLMMAGYCRNM
jgi:hypothetical protein